MNIYCKLASLGYISDEGSKIYTVLFFIDLDDIVISKKETSDFLSLKFYHLDTS